MGFRTLLFGLAAAAAPLAAQTAPDPLPVEGRPAEPPKADWELYGFGQVDLISDFGGRMNPDWADAFRPSRIATPEGQFGSNGEFRASVKQSRLGFKANDKGGLKLAAAAEFAADDIDGGAIRFIDEDLA